MATKGMNRKNVESYSNGLLTKIGRKIKEGKGKKGQYQGIN